MDDVVEELRSRSLSVANKLERMLSMLQELREETGPGEEVLVAFYGESLKALSAAVSRRDAVTAARQIRRMEMVGWLAELVCETLDSRES